MRVRVPFSLRVATAVAIAGFCAGTQSYAQSGAVSVIGTLTDEGVECPAMRGDDGKLYTLTPAGATSGYGPGDRVQVNGTVAEMSICQQGTTISVLGVQPMPQGAEQSNPSSKPSKAPLKAQKPPAHRQVQLRPGPAPAATP